MTHVLSLDPGGDTGLASFWVQDGKPADLLKHEEIPNGVGGVLSRVGSLWADHLVIESFELGDYTEDPNLDAVKIIWALEGYDQAHADMKANEGFSFWPKVKLVQRSGPKDLFPNAILKRAGYHPKHGEVKGGHSRDAIRIGLWYIVNVLKHRPTQLALWPKED